MDQEAEGNFGIENPEISEPSSEKVAVVNESIADSVPDINSKYAKNEIGNKKSRIQNDKTKEITVVSVFEKRNLERKTAHPPISEMVMDSIKALKKRNGASYEDIRNRIKDNYEVDMKRLEYHINKFLLKSVDNRILEKVGKDGTEGKFKIKKSENIKRDSKNVPQKEEKKKSKKKMPATKNQGKVKTEKKMPAAKNQAKVKTEKKLPATKNQGKAKTIQKYKERKYRRIIQNLQILLFYVFFFIFTCLYLLYLNTKKKIQKENACNKETENQTRKENGCNKRASQKVAKSV